MERVELDFVVLVSFGFEVVDFYLFVLVYNYITKQLLSISF